MGTLKLYATEFKQLLKKQILFKHKKMHLTTAFIPWKSFHKQTSDIKVFIIKHLIFI